MGQTAIASGSGLAPKKWSDALFAMVAKQPTPVNSLAGPAPTIDKAAKVLRRQSTTDMPIVRVTDLAQSAGDNVRVDLAHIVKIRPVMGDQNAEGKGAKLDYSYDDIKIDMATLPVSAGGKMTQKRFQHDLRVQALAQLKGAIPAFRWQRTLAHMAGARGAQDSLDWVLPLATDPEFAEFMVNALKAPTYNRHYVIDGGQLVQGGQALANVDSADNLKLSHIDDLSAIVAETSLRMLPIRIPGDMAAGDDPIKGLFLLDNLAWQSIITDTTAGNNIRTWQTNALERAKYGNITAHPLFSGGAFLWNNILVRRLGDFAVRFNAGDNVAHVSAANRYTATETNVAVAAGLSTTHQISRSLLLGGQAVAMCDGVNTSSEVSYSLLENQTNFGRNHEMAGELICSEKKLRFALPDGLGNMEPTDIGVMVIDSVTKKVAV
jgi:hypothetical protein